MPVIQRTCQRFLQAGKMVLYLVRGFFVNIEASFPQKLLSHALFQRALPRLHK